MGNSRAAYQHYKSGAPGAPVSCEAPSSALAPLRNRFSRTRRFATLLAGPIHGEVHAAYYMQAQEIRRSTGGAGTGDDAENVAVVNHPSLPKQALSATHHVVGHRRVIANHRGNTP